MDKYFLAINQKQYGPYPIEEIRKMRVPTNALVWTEGMDSWIEARFIFDQEILIPSTPPPIPLPNTQANLSAPIPKIINKEKNFRVLLRKELIHNAKIAIFCLAVSALIGGLYYLKQKGLSLHNLYHKYKDAEALLENKKMDTASYARKIRYLDSLSRKLGFGLTNVRGEEDFFEDVQEKLEQVKFDALKVFMNGFFLGTFALIGIRYAFNFIQETLEAKKKEV